MKIETDILKTGLLVALLVGVYAGVVFWPGEKQSQAMADEIQAKESQLGSMQQPDLAPLHSEIASLRAELRERSVELPVGGLHDRVLHHVSDTLLDHRITEYETSYGDQKTYKRFAVTPIDVRFQGRFTQVFEVIRSIEYDGPPVRIEQLELSGSDDDVQGTVGVRMRLSSFFLPTQQEGGQR